MIRGITVALMVANILISIFIILINEELWIKILPLPWLFPSSYFSGSSHVPVEFPIFLSLLGFSDTRNLLASTHNWGWSSPAKVLKCVVSTTNAWFDWDGVACPHNLILYSVQANITYEWKQSVLNCRLILNPWSTQIPKLCVQLIFIFFNQRLTFIQSIRYSPFLQLFSSFYTQILSNKSNSPQIYSYFNILSISKPTSFKEYAIFPSPRILDILIWRVNIFLKENR